MSQNSENKLASAKEVFGVYWQHTRQYPWLFALTIVGGIGLQAAFLGAPLFLRNFFNTLATHSPDASLIPQLTGFLVMLTILYLAEWGFRRLQNWANIVMQAKVLANLLESAFGYLIGHSYNFFTSRFAGSLTHRVNKFSKAYEALFDSIIVSFFPTFLFVVGAIVVLTLRHPLLGAMLAVWTVCFITFQTYVSLLRQPLRVKRSEAETNITATLADSISNHSTVMLFTGVKHEQGVFRRVVEIWQKINLRAWYADEWTWAGIGLFMVGIEIALLWGAMHLWAQNLLTVGDFVLIQAYLLTTFDRLVGINRELRRFYDAFADAAEMVAMLQLPHEIKDAKNAKKLKVPVGEINVDAISFYFHKKTQILKNLSFTIPGGQRVALVGPSGAGKSTITKLLLRMYDVSTGAIKIDGQDIAKVTQDSLREAIAFVPQEPVLFHRSLMDNIRYGRRSATDEEVIAAAKKAHCHEFIEGLSDGYNTFVGERGIKLSGGERQRVAIARAILKNSPILVLDEATSSLDSESESLIQDALETLMQGKTVIVIAHRLSTIMKMDRIVVLEDGRVVADGTHDELLKEEGLYHKLWSIQAGGFIGLPEETNTKSIADTETEEDKNPIV